MTENNHTDVDAQVGTIAGHADSCLIDAQACVAEGKTDRARELREIGETWVRLLHALVGSEPSEWTG